MPVAIQPIPFRDKARDAFRAGSLAAAQKFGFEKSQQQYDSQLGGAFGLGRDGGRASLGKVSPTAAIDELDAQTQALNNRLSPSEKEAGVKRAQLRKQYGGKAMNPRQKAIYEANMSRINRMGKAGMMVPGGGGGSFQAGGIGLSRSERGDRLEGLAARRAQRATAEPKPSGLDALKDLQKKNTGSPLTTPPATIGGNTGASVIGGAVSNALNPAGAGADKTVKKVATGFNVGGRKLL